MNKQPYLTLAVITGLMLFGAIIEFPYVYYQILRWVVCGVAILVAYFALKYKKTWTTVLFGIIAALFNPIFPIHLTREVWFPIDLVCGLLFILSPNYLKEKVEEY